MKSALSLTLILCLVASALPANAQTEAGPLARAVTREAVRLATAGPPPSSGGNTIEQRTTPAGSAWLRVRELAPQTEIIVTIKGAAAPGRFLAADDFELTMANAAAQVAHIPRTDITEVSVVVRRSIRRAATRGAGIGAGGGVVTGLVSLADYCKSHTCDTAPVVVMTLDPMMGAYIGAGIGLLVGVARHKTRSVIYHAP